MNRNTLIILLLLFAFFYFNSSNRPRIFPTPFQPTPDSVIPGGGFFGGGKFLRTISKVGLALLLFAEPPPPDIPRPATHSIGADGYLTLDHGASL